jgi:uroporphyrinogen decarboxylase
MAKTHLNHRERLETCLAGGRPDRIPVSLWRHFPVDDQNPYSLAAQTAAFQKTYDFDFVKVTPASSFCLKDWGVEDRWMGDSEGTREYTRRVIRRPEDWFALTIPEPEKGHLGEQLTCLNELNKALDGSAPFIQTIFNPLSQARNLVGGEDLLVHMRKYPEALHAGLRKITETTLRFIERAAQTGVAGFFYAVQHAQYSLLSTEEYQTFGKIYDLKLLEATRGFWLNVLHLHGEDVMFDLLRDYPVQVINWHDRSSPPTLAEAQQKFEGALCGGLRQWETMVMGSNERVRSEARDAIQATGGRRFILGTGCVVPVIAPRGNIQAARACADEIEITQ